MSNLLNYIKEQRKAQPFPVQQAVTASPLPPAQNTTPLAGYIKEQRKSRQMGGGRQQAKDYGLAGNIVKLPSSIENQGYYDLTKKLNQQNLSENSTNVYNTYYDYVKKQNESLVNQFNTKPVNDVAKGLSNITKIKDYFPVDLTFGTTHDGESMIKMKGFRDNDKTMGFFRVDKPHKNATWYHINTVENELLPELDLNSLQKKVLTGLNHREISEHTYNALRNFDDIAETAKIAGRAAGTIGVVFDTYEFGKTVYKDLNDRDGKLGHDTVETVFGISSGWVGGTVGTKFGTIGGSAIGTAICPGLGTVIGGFIGGSIGGIMGTTAGRELAELFTDQLYEVEKYAF